MEQKTKEEELNIVLKNYDKVREERNTLQKQIAALKSELDQQKTLYRNMLDRYAGKQQQDWEARYKELKKRYDEKNNDRSRIMNDNARMRVMIDSVRGTLCNAHNIVDNLCEKLSISNHVSADPTILTRPIEVEQPKPAPIEVEPPMNIAKFQQQQFIKYIREMAKTLKSTGTLKGIARLAQEYAVTSITKVKFFQYHLDDDNLTDEKILDVYERLKRKMM